VVRSARARTHTDGAGQATLQSAVAPPASPKSPPTTQPTEKNGDDDCNSCKLEYRSSWVVAAMHLGLAVDASACPNMRTKKFNVQFGPQFFPVAAGKFVSYPKWTSPLLEARQTVSCKACKCLLKLHDRNYNSNYLLIGPNSNSALHDTIIDCGLTLPKLKSPRVSFWGIDTDPGMDTKGR
jgi:hypothetical protein